MDQNLWQFISDNLLLIWMGLVILLLLIEVATQGLTTIWFAGGALVAAVAAGLHAPFWIQFALFSVVSIVVMLLVRPMAKRMTRRSLTPTNADELIGKTARVCETIDEAAGTGQIRVRDLEWSARSLDGSVIEKDTDVVIREIRGVKLMVEKREGGC